MATILIADDEGEILSLTADTLEMIGHQTVAAPNQKEAFEALKSHPEIDLCLVDLHWGNKDNVDGYKIARAAREAGKQAIIMTGGLIPDYVKSEFPILYKPFKMSQLKAIIEKVVEPQESAPEPQGRDTGVQVSGWNKLGLMSPPVPA
jgi:DNA-binding NtrC family response regulator